MSGIRRTAPPGGMPPPEQAVLPDGTVVELRPLAAAITEAHLERHPEDAARYGGELARQWCTHDNQHILAWAIGDLDLPGQLDWLARVLDARGYPLTNLFDSVNLGADVVAHELRGDAGREVAERLRRAVRHVQEQHSG